MPKSRLTVGWKRYAMLSLRHRPGSATKARTQAINQLHAVMGTDPGLVKRACIHVCVRWVLYCCGWCESRPERRVL